MDRKLVGENGEYLYMDTSPKEIIFNILSGYYELGGECHRSKEVSNGVKVEDLFDLSLAYSDANGYYMDLHGKVYRGTEELSEADFLGQRGYYINDMFRSKHLLMTNSKYQMWALRSVYMVILIDSNMKITLINVESNLEDAISIAESQANCYMGRPVTVVKVIGSVQTELMTQWTRTDN